MTTISLEGLGFLAVNLTDMAGLLAFVGEKAKDVIEQEGKADTGGDLILSNFARGRVKMAVEQSISGATLTLTGTPPGPWSLIESGSHKAGWWIPRKGGHKVVLPGGNVRNYVRHGAVRAKLTFTRARGRIDAQAAGWAGAYVHELVAKAA